MQTRSLAFCTNLVLNTRSSPCFPCSLVFSSSAHAQWRLLPPPPSHNPLWEWRVSGAIFSSLRFTLSLISQRSESVWRNERVRLSLGGWLVNGAEWALGMASIVPSSPPPLPSRLQRIDGNECTWTRNATRRYALSSLRALSHLLWPAMLSYFCTLFRPFCPLDKAFAWEWGRSRCSTLVSTR